MKNKTISIFIIILILLLLICTPTFANTTANTNVLVGSEIVDETIKERENYIVDSVNNVFETEDKDLIDGSNIDYSKIIRIFNGSDLLKYEELTIEKMEEYTYNQEAVYLLPVYGSGITVLSTLEIREPLKEEEKDFWTDEEFEYFQNQVGKWYISVKEARPNKVDYKSTLQKVLEKNHIENRYVFFVRNICSCIDLAAVICNDDLNDTRFLVLEQYGVETGKIDEVYDNEMLLSEDTLYTYNEIKEIYDNEQKEYEKLKEQYGENAKISGFEMTNYSHSNTVLIILIVSGVGIAAIAAAVIIVIRKKKKAKNIES